MLSNRTIPVEIKILDKRVSQDLVCNYATDGSAAFDIRANAVNPIKLWPNENKLIPTGMAIWIKNPEYAGFVFSRSGLGNKHNIIINHSVGLIDSDYQGELFVPIWNKSDDLFTIRHGDRIAQIVFMPVMHMVPQFVEEFSNETERGEGGFGHTGV